MSEHAHLKFSTETFATAALPYHLKPLLQVTTKTVDYGVEVTMALTHPDQSEPIQVSMRYETGENFHPKATGMAAKRLASMWPAQLQYTDCHEPPSTQT
jgi:hypothetical protein